MRLKFLTLTDKPYYVRLESYQTFRNRKNVSTFQFEWKKFFMDIFPKDFWTEEFPARPLYHHRYRLDLFNFSRKVAIECHGDQHVKVSKHFHGDDLTMFLDALTKDREKELWCEKNDITLISVYTSTPKDLEFFKKKYPSIKWPTK